MNLFLYDIERVIHVNFLPIKIPGKNLVMISRGTQINPAMSYMCFMPTAFHCRSQELEVEH